MTKNVIEIDSVGHWNFSVLNSEKLADEGNLVTAHMFLAERGTTTLVSFSYVVILKMTNFTQITKISSK